MATQQQSGFLAKPPSIGLDGIRIFWDIPFDNPWSEVAQAAVLRLHQRLQQPCTLYLAASRCDYPPHFLEGIVWQLGVEDELVYWSHLRVTTETSPTILDVLSLCLEDTPDIFQPIPELNEGAGVCWWRADSQDDGAIDQLAGLLEWLLTSSDIRHFLMGYVKEEAHIAPSSSTWRMEGPHQGSYSLAMVNRALARALTQSGQVTHLSRLGSLTSSDLPHLPTWSNLEAVDDWQRQEAALLAKQRSRLDECVLYNDYPLNIWSLAGAKHRILANYAWEESGYPATWVADINAQIELVTAVSPLVKKILRDQGVRVPIAIVGNGLDHEFQPSSPVDQAQAKAEVAQALASIKSFCFLHISSGLKRKGVDVLCQAYAQAFTDADDVTLIIKTVDNPENVCQRELAAMQVQYPHAPHVILITEDWSPAHMEALYAASHTLVMPSRAEGFGLPAAEAIQRGIPVIASGFGGQVSLSQAPGLAFIDYQFVPSESHLGLTDSVWVEPSVTHLAQLMRAWAFAPKEALQHLARQAQENYAYSISWQAVAQATLEAWDTVNQAGLPDLPRIAWVSTFQSACGIATYSENLVRALDVNRLLVFANTDAQSLGSDFPYVKRNWERGQARYDGLIQDIKDSDVDVVMIQSQPGLMSFQALTHLLSALISFVGAGKIKPIQVYVTLHNTREWFENPVMTQEERAIWQRTTRLLVHSVEDLNYLKSAGLVDNVTYWPHGIYDAPQQIRARQTLGIPNDVPLLGTFGFLQSHKGQEALLQALAALIQTPELAQAHLLMLNTVLDNEDSQATSERCQALIQALGLQDRVHAIADFLPEQVALETLAMVDAVIYPYQQTQESASGAVRMGLATGRPVLVTPLAIFDDMGAAVYRTSGATASDLTQDIHEWWRQQLQLKKQGQSSPEQVAAQQLLLMRDWYSLSWRLRNLMEGAFSDPFPV